MSANSTSPRVDWSLPLFGLFSLALVGGMLALNLRPEWRANHAYVEEQCVVLDKRLVEHSKGGRPGITYRPEFLIRYTVAGRPYETWTYDAVHAFTGLRGPNERVLDDFTVGQQYPCWYDPADPSEVVLVRGYSWMSYGLALAFVALVFLTGTGVLRRLRSARHAPEDASGAGGGPGVTNG
jgi:hypothetical protein